MGVRFEERARAVGDIFEVATILDATLLPSGKHTRNLWNISFFFFNGKINYKWLFSIAMLKCYVGVLEGIYIYISIIVDLPTKNGVCPWLC